MKTRRAHQIAFLSSVIKRRREALGLTQSEVALLAGLKQANYSRMESGRQAPNLETLFAVLDALGLNLSVSSAENTVYHVMHQNRPVADVILSRDRKKIQYFKHVPDGLRQPFSGKKLDVERFYRFLKSRCYEDGRADLDMILKKAGFKDNNPYDWIRLTHGVTYDDFFWIKINDEQITWDEVKIR